MSRLLVRADVMPREWGELRGGRPGGFTGIPLRDRSVHCAITSPPYWGLRDYGTAIWEGGYPDCSHPVKAWHGPKQTGQGQNGHAASENRLGRKVCLLCGAIRKDWQLGLEPTPWEYVDHMVAVFSEVYRVLRDDGTLWLNLGDSYSGYHGNKNHEIPTSSTNGWTNGYNENLRGQKPQDSGLKPKELVGIPWRVAFALSEAGWYRRAEIIWHKPNPMTESVSDRPVRAHEQIFLFSKRPRYYYDREAVREPLAVASVEREKAGYKAAFASQFQGSPTDHRFPGGKALDSVVDMAGRLLRSVWKVPVAGSREKHYASYPERLVIPCIKAGTSEKGVCPACGAPWRRVVEKKRIPTRPGNNSKVYVDPDGSPYEQHSGSVVGNRDPKRHVTMTVTLGWEPTCSCDAGDPIPAVVLDPFTGTSTTGKVARDLGRRFVGLDLKGEYLEISRRRLDEPLRPPGTKKPRRVSIPNQGSLFDPTE